MLKGLRQSGTGQALMAALVMGIIVVFLLEFRSTSRMRTGSIRRECAARIDGECITSKDFFAEFGLVVPRGMSAKQIKAYSLRKQVLDGVIEREILVAEARRLGLAADEEAAKKELRLGRAHVSLPAASALRLGYMLDLVNADENGVSRDLVRDLPVFDAKTQEVDDALYARVVRSMTNRSPKEFLKMQVRELTAARLRDLVRARIRVSEDEAFDTFLREKSKAVVRSVRVESDWFARYGTSASDADVDAWALAHKTQVDDAWKTEAPKWKADCVLASEIVGTFTPDSSEADKTLLKDKLDRAKGLLDKGRPFGDVARELSDGPAALIGGEIGCFTPEGYGDGGDVIAKAITGATPGTTTGILETKRGYHLIRVDGRLAAGDVETVGRRAVARTFAVRDLAERRAKEFAERLIRAAAGGARLDDTLTKVLPEFTAAGSATKNLDRTAAATSSEPSRKDDKAPADDAMSGALDDPHVPKMEVSAPFTLDGDPIPGTVGAPISKMAFDLAKPDDVVPEPIAVLGGVIVLQLKEKTVATKDEFKAASSEVVQKLEIAKRADALAKYVGRLRQAKQSKIEVSERILDEPKTSDDD